MRPKRLFQFLMLSVSAGAMLLPGTARAQGEISISIDKHARLTSNGGVVFTVHMTCGPLPGTPDFTEALTSAGQEKRGATAEGGLSPDIVCDGVGRVYTASLSPLTDDVFVRGPAGARVSVTACSLIGDEQFCLTTTAERRIIVAGPLVA
jgi:hypothetical protein